MESLNRPAQFHAQIDRGLRDWLDELREEHLAKNLRPMGIKSCSDATLLGYLVNEFKKLKGE